MSSFLRVAWVVVKKDLTVEVRSLEILSTTMFFAVTVVLMFSFGLVVDGRPLNDVAAAILWVAIAFSGTLALGRTFERERQHDTLRALLLAPADRPALYVGKLVGILLLLGLVELVLVPLVGLLFNAPVIAQAIPLAGLVILGHARIRVGGDAVCRDAGARAQPRCTAAHHVVSHDRSGHDCWCSGHRRAVPAHARSGGGAVLVGAAGRIRRGLRHPRAVDVRAGDDRVMDFGFQMSDLGLWGR